MKNNWEFKEGWYKNKSKREWKFKGEIQDEEMTNYDPYIFISYSHADIDEVIAMVEVLYRVYGLNIWFDEKMKKGDDWLEKAEAAMYRASGLLVIISKDSLKSEPVKTELDFFSTSPGEGKFICPINNTGEGKIEDLIKKWQNGQEDIKMSDWKRVQYIVEKYLQGNRVLYAHLNLTDPDFYMDIRSTLEEKQKKLNIKQYDDWDDERAALEKAINEVVTRNLKDAQPEPAVTAPPEQTPEQASDDAEKEDKPAAPPEPPAEGVLQYEIKSGEVNARYTQKTDEYGKATYILHAGSRIARTVAVSAPDGAKRKRQELEAAGMLVDSVVHTEVEFGSSSALGCFCRGSSESGTRFVKASRLISGNDVDVSNTANETETDAALCVPEVREPESQEFVNNKDIEYYETTKAGVNARYKVIAAENGKTFILLSGSRINPSVANSAPGGAKKRREELAAEGKLVDSVVTVDVEFTSASALASFCVGGSKSGTEFMEKDSRLVNGAPAAEGNNATEASAEAHNGYSNGIIGENRLFK